MSSQTKPVRYRGTGDERHIIHAAYFDGDDRTLCGDALEGACREGDVGEVIEVTRGKINCPSCQRAISHCKAIPARFIASAGKDAG